MYPAVKAHLLSFGKERLEQTGKKYIINGEEIKARKKTSNKWFETQDSISYWDDFFKPKIVWARLMRISNSEIDSFPRFSKADAGYFVVDSLCFFTGKDIDKLCTFLNSSLATYYYLKNIAILDNGGMQMRQQYIEEIPCPPIESIEDDISIYNLFGFTREEIDFIINFIEMRKNEILNSGRAD